MNKAKCPSCKNTVEFEEKIKVQDLITCPHCKSLLELVNQFPPTLDWAEDTGISSRQFFPKMY